MSVRNLGARALAVVCFSIGVSSSASQAAEPVAVAWTDLVRQVEEHPRLRAGRARVGTAEAGVWAAGQLPSPTLDAAFGRGWEHAGPAAAFEQEWELSVPLEWLAQRGPRVDAAKAGVEEARAEAEALRREVLSSLSDLFWELVHGQARVESLAASVSQIEQFVSLVRRRAEQGEARPVEVPRAETELEKARAELAAARSRVRTGRELLRLWLPGLPAGSWRVEADLEALPGAPDVSEARERAARGHPAVQAAQARSAGLVAEAELERRQRVPSFSVKAFAASELDRVSAGGGVSVSLPVFGLNGGRIAQAEAAAQAQRLAAEAQARELAAAAVESALACEQGLEAARRQGAEVLPRAERAAAMAQRSFELGETGLLEVLDARRVLGEARRERLDALLGAQIACRRLQLLQGEAP